MIADKEEDIESDVRSIELEIVENKCEKLTLWSCGSEPGVDH